MPLALSPLQDPADPRLPQLLDLYALSFPPEEQKSTAALLHMLQNPIYRFTTAHDSSHPDTVLGLSIAAHPTSAPISLLEYLATAPATRNQGIGRALFHHATAHLQQRTLLLEVEAQPPSAHPDSLEVRRRRFYRSLNARELLGLDYQMPAVGAGNPPAMHLFLHAPHAPATISRDTLHTWLIALYTEVYQQPADDPRIAHMLSSLSMQVPLA